MDDQTPKPGPFQDAVNEMDKLILHRIEQRLAPLLAQIEALQERVERLEAQVAVRDTTT